MGAKSTPRFAASVLIDVGRFIRHPELTFAMPEKTIETKRGRPENPYRTRPKLWSVDTAREWLLNDPTDLDSSRIAPDTAADDIWGLVNGAEVPVTRRRWLQAMLVFGFGRHPEDVTAALDAIRNRQYRVSGVVRSSHDLGDSEESALFTHGGEPAAAELRYLRQSINERKRWIDKPAGGAGESFVRCAIIASGCYTKVTSVKRLGREADSKGKNMLDIKATEARMDITHGVSVKNTSEVLFPGNKSVKDAYAKAKAHSVIPMLVVPFATPEARERCEKDGIVLVELGG